MPRFKPKTFLNSTYLPLSFRENLGTLALRYKAVRWTELRVQSSVSPPVRRVSEHWNTRIHSGEGVTAYIIIRGCSDRLRRVSVIFSWANTSRPVSRSRAAGGERERLHQRRTYEDISPETRSSPTPGSQQVRWQSVTSGEIFHETSQRWRSSVWATCSVG